MSLPEKARTVFIRFLVFSIYCLIGAAVFQAVEQKHEEQLSKRKPLEVLRENLSMKYNISSEDFKNIIESVAQGLTPERSHNDWNLPNSLFFVVITLTTIGYGHITPDSWQGQLFCILFSLIGIPITGLLLKSVGESITATITKLLLYLQKEPRPSKIRVKCVLVTFILMVLIIILGGAITSHLEGWTPMEGIYYCFVTLSTIGFGDYVLNHGRLVHPQPAKAVLVNLSFLYLIIGLCIVSSVVLSISNVLEKREADTVVPLVKRFVNSVKRKKTVEENVDNFKDCACADDGSVIEPFSANPTAIPVN